MSVGRGPVGAVVLGGSGYVAGELLRWIAGHPELRLAGAASASHGGEAVADSFPNLAEAFPERRFTPEGGLVELVRRAAGEFPRLAAFSAAPHGSSASRIASLLEATDRLGVEIPVVDLSADFRHRDPERYQEIYGAPHPVPELLAEFRCELPELDRGGEGNGPGRIAHPGCFSTAVALAAAPLLRAGFIEPELHASAITGSTGSGGRPSPTTHHPVRHANLFAYRPLRHRHRPEMESLLGLPENRVRFVPHSGPFARGIHATVFARGTAPRDTGELEACLADFYAGAPLVRVAAAPRLKETVGSSIAVVGAAADGDGVAVFCALDNLGKGAASGGVQWMNRLLDLPEDAGLRLPPPDWI